MFYYLKGKLVHLQNDFAVLDCGGVGFRITVSGNTFARISSQMDHEVMLYTYLNVREDILELYGFATNDEHAYFSKLIGVSGVGPKAAMSILTSLTTAQLALCVQSGDAKTIAKSNGVGLKTAQKVIIELKGKLDLTGETESGGASSASSPMNDAVEALVVLGYSRAEATEALKGADYTKPLEEIITYAFRRLNRF